MRIADTAEFYYYPELRGTYPMRPGFLPYGTYPMRESYSPAVYPSKLLGLEGPFIKLPDSVERAIGQLSEKSAVDQSKGAYPDPEATAYVNAIGQKLAKNSNRPNFGYKFGIVNDPAPNAFALPNGSIYATMGLLQHLKNESQLANVLGHEVSHVTQHHTAKQIQLNAGTGILGTLASAILAGAVGKEESKAIRDLTLGVIQNGYSRDNEAEADERGQALAANSGWSPRGMVETMTYFQSLQKEKPGAVEALMRSHPDPGDRVNVATARLSQLPEGDVGADRYQAFLARLGGGAVQAPGIPSGGYKVNEPSYGQKAAAVAGPSEFPLIPVIAVSGGALLLLIVLLKR